MEYKTLKIDSDLHEKLKTLSETSKTSLQNLIDNKLNELISHNDDVMLNIKDINYNNLNKVYSLQFDDQSFKKLINFFEIFLTNRNLKNINEINNLLTIINTLKSNLTTNSKIDKKYDNMSLHEAIYSLGKTEDSLNYSVIEKDYEKSMNNILSNLNTNDLDKTNKLEHEKIDEKIEIKITTSSSLREKVVEHIKKSPYYLIIGDVINDTKNNIDYEVCSIINDIIILKSISSGLIGLEKTISLEQLYENSIYKINNRIYKDFIRYNKLTNNIVYYKEYLFNKECDLKCDIKNNYEYLDDDKTNFLLDEIKSCEDVYDLNILEEMYKKITDLLLIYRENYVNEKFNIKK